MNKALTVATLLLALGQAVVGPVESGAAEPQIYVTEDYTITLRTGPSLQNKVIAELRNGTKLEKLKDEGEWLYVRTQDGKTGYVMRRYITNKPPLSLQFEEYKAKNQEMLDKATQIESIIGRYEEEKRGLEKALAETRTERDTLARNHEDLKVAAADVVGLEAKYRQTSAELANTNILLESTKAENESLKNMRDLKWFLSGAGVLLSGWFLGFITGSINKKRKTSRLYM